MTTTLKAIETVYNGYRFRSRLEARWAVFFDTLGIRYEYEKEGFTLGPMGSINAVAGDDNEDCKIHDSYPVLSYLPDFWLPDFECWIEIKPDSSTGEEQLKCRRLAFHSGYPVYLFDTGLKFSVEDEVVPHAWKYEAKTGSILGAAWSWCECPVCKGVGLYSVDADTGMGSLMHIPCLLSHLRTFRTPFDAPKEFFYSMDTSLRLMAAYTAARQARFEHGAHGK